jgi:hypothetical protein
MHMPRITSHTQHNMVLLAGPLLPTSLRAVQHLRTVSAINDYSHSLMSTSTLWQGGLLQGCVHIACVL